MPYSALELINFSAWHQHQGPLIRGLNVKINQGATIAFLSPYQYTRRLLIDSLAGRHKLIRGSIRILNVETSHLDSHRLEAVGMVLCDPHTGIVPHFNCEENLLLPPGQAALSGGGLPLGDIFRLFPQLEVHLTSLSSRLEPSLKYQLAWARALRTGASIFLFDSFEQHLPAQDLPHLRTILQWLNARNYTIILNEDSNSQLQHLAGQIFNIETLNGASRLVAPQPPPHGLC